MRAGLEEELWFRRGCLSLFGICAPVLLALAGCTGILESGHIALQEPETPHAYRIVSSFSCNGGTVRFTQQVDAMSGRNAIFIDYRGTYFSGAQKLADKIVEIGGDELNTARITLLRCPSMKAGNGLSAIATVHGDQQVFFHAIEGEVVID